MVLQDLEIEDLRWVDGLHNSWESGLSRDDTSDYLSRGSSFYNRSTPLRDTTNHYWSSFHNPSKTYKREQIITSYKCLKEEEEILGRKMLHIDSENATRKQVKRCKSERCTDPERIPRRVKRTYSVIHRYDPSVERIVTEYKCFNKAEPKVETQQDEPASIAHTYKFNSQPDLAQKKEKPKKAKRSFTTMLGLKIINMISRKH